MGTTTIHTGTSNPKKCFEIYNRVYLGDVKTQSNGFKFEIVDYSVSYGESWSVMKKTEPDGKEVWFLVAYCTSYRSKEHYAYGVKEMEVSCGPYLYKCPKRLVDLVQKNNPDYFNSGYAKNWFETWQIRKNKKGKK